jgi:hypothetical protein
MYIYNINKNKFKELLRLAGSCGFRRNYQPALKFKELLRQSGGPAVRRSAACSLLQLDFLRMLIK